MHFLKHNFLESLLLLITISCIWECNSFEGSDSSLIAHKVLNILKETWKLSVLI